MDWGRLGTGIATGGFSELERAGVGPSASLGKNTAGGKGGSGPTAPDFNEAARIQAESSLTNTREQTAANRPDQYGPFGSSTWSQGADGRWTQNTSLAPGLDAGAQNLMGQISTQGPAMTGDQARDQAIEAAYSQAASRLDPQWTQREDRLQNQLANQGFSLTDEAAQTAMGNFGRDRNDAYSSAMNGAIGQGTAAGAATFAQNQAAQMAPYQQLGMLRGLSSPQSFTAAGQADPLQSLAAAMQGYGANVDQYNAGQAGKNSTMSGLGAMAPLVLRGAAGGVG
jgi:hypothetical protein